MTPFYKIFLHELSDKFLTFSPISERIDQILNLGEAHGARFTFFVTTDHIRKQNGHILEKIAAKGHEIASHSHHHLNFLAISYEDAVAQIEKSLKILSRFSEVHGFRAPYLMENENVWRACRRLGLKYNSSAYGEHIVLKDGLWTVPVTRPMDYEVVQKQGLVDTLSIGEQWVEYAGPGQVLLFHPWRLGTSKYIKFLDTMLQKPLRFTTIKDHIDDPESCCISFDLDFLEHWQVYAHTIKHLVRSPHLSTTRKNTNTAGA